jgi:hypothetical protein
MTNMELNDYEVEQIRLMRMDPEVRRVEILLKQKAAIETQLASEKSVAILADESKVAAMSDDVKTIISTKIK